MLNSYSAGRNFKCGKRTQLIHIWVFISTEILEKLKKEPSRRLEVHFWVTAPQTVFSSGKQTMFAPCSFLQFKQLRGAVHNEAHAHLMSKGSWQAWWSSFPLKWQKQNKKTVTIQPNMSPDFATVKAEIIPPPPSWAHTILAIFYWQHVIKLNNLLIGQELSAFRELPSG